MRAVLATGLLDVGGVEAVVAMLAEGLASHGVDPVVLCSRAGRTADDLRRAGVCVIEAGDRAAASRALAVICPEVVQLHAPPAFILEAARAVGVALVPVVHNVEIHRRPAQWEEVSRLAADASLTIAVSATVAEHHSRHLRDVTRAPIRVIPNSAPKRSTGDLTRPSRLVARRLLRDVAGIPDRAVVVVCLARYDAQKNLTGLVEAFLDAAARRPGLHLVVAGDPVDRLELLRVEAHRRSRRHADQVRLLGHCDTATLLAAGDAFVLDSFFEGWPVAATEAAMAGLPLILADVGGAAELVGTGGNRGVVVSNPYGRTAAAVDDRAVRVARRRVRRQPNRDELARALVKLHDQMPSWAEQRDGLSATARQSLRPDVMVAGHADVLRAAARGQDRLGRGGGGS